MKYSEAITLAYDALIEEATKHNFTFPRLFIQHEGDCTWVDVFSQGKDATTHQFNLYEVTPGHEPWNKDTSGQTRIFTLGGRDTIRPRPFLVKDNEDIFTLVTKSFNTGENLPYVIIAHDPAQLVVCLADLENGTENISVSKIYESIGLPPGTVDIRLMDLSTKASLFCRTERRPQQAKEGE
jgi:hypothetical protein